MSAARIHETERRAVKAALFAAAAAVPRSFGPGLLPRSATDQGIITAFMAAGSYAVSALTQGIIEDTAEVIARLVPSDTRRTAQNLTTAANAAAIAAGIGVQAILPVRQNESLWRSGARTAARTLTQVGLCGIAATASDEIARLAPMPQTLRQVPPEVVTGAIVSMGAELFRRRRDTVRTKEFEGRRVAVGKSLATGAVVGAAILGVNAADDAYTKALTKVAGRVLPDHPGSWRPLGRAAGLATLGIAGIGAFQYMSWLVERGVRKPEPGFTEPPMSGLVSGGPGSYVPYETLAREGRRHVLTVVNEASMRDALGVALLADPIRVYVGIDSAPTDDERVMMALAEVERTGALDRGLVLLASPTGSGYVNHIAMQALEMYTRGDCASILIQYGNRPSVLSLGRMAQAREQNRKLWLALQERIRHRPENDRPKVVLFGESLGAATSQDVFLHWGTDGPQVLGIEHALWLGTPYFSGWKEQVMRDDGPNIDHSLIRAFNDFGQVEALEVDEREALRYYLLNHDNDAVTYFTPNILVERPSWLGSERPAGVSPAQRYGPILTFVQTIIDMKNAMDVVPGRFIARGHDYRADLARFIPEAFQLPVSEDTILRVEKAMMHFDMGLSDYIETAKATAHDANEDSPPML